MKTNFRTLFKVYKNTIEFLYNFNNKYLNKDTEALDEVIKDPLDYEIAWNIDTTFPEEFIYDPRQIFDQRVNWYRSSCTAQWTAWASDTIHKYKASKQKVSPWALRDEVKKRWLGKEWNWAYLIDTIKVAKDLFKVDWYFRVLTHEALKQALYNTNIIVTWSSKIDWKRLWETWYIVDKVSVWSWHAFYLVWWNKIGYVAMNSYSDKYWKNWTFIIPYDLFFKVAFNSTYALVVDPQWTKYSREELYQKYLVTKKS